MTLQQWFDNRKRILLIQKRDNLFNTLPHASDFRMTRVELYNVLSRMEMEKRETMEIPTPSMGIPMLA